MYRPELIKTSYADKLKCISWTSGFKVKTNKAQEELLAAHEYLVQMVIKLSPKINKLRASGLKKANAAQFTDRLLLSKSQQIIQKI